MRTRTFWNTFGVGGALLCLIFSLYCFMPTQEVEHRRTTSGNSLILLPRRLLKEEYVRPVAYISLTVGLLGLVACYAFEPERKKSRTRY